MKMFLISGLLALGSLTQAQSTRWTYDSKECDKMDVKVDVYVTVDEIDPRLIYVREKDRVCMVVHGLDTSVNLTIKTLPVLVTTKKGTASMVTFRAEKAGEFDLVCRGCADGRNFKGAKLVVQKMEDFDKAQEEDLRRDSELYRKKIKKEKDPRDYRDSMNRYR